MYHPYLCSIGFLNLFVPQTMDLMYVRVGGHPVGGATVGIVGVDILATWQKLDDEVCFSPHPPPLTPNGAPVDGGRGFIRVSMAFMLCDFL